MTQKGEKITPDGENFWRPNLTSFDRLASLIYTAGNNPPEELRVRINLSEPTTSQFLMIFSLRGTVQLINIENNEIYTRIESQQHNLLRIDPQMFRIDLDTEEEPEIFCINLSPAFLDRYLPDSHPVRQLIGKETGDKQPACVFSGRTYITPEMSAILLELDRCRHTEYCNQLILESKAINLLALQISQFEHLQNSRQPSLLKPEELEKMYKARLILLSHSAEKLSLRTLAHTVGTNEFTLKRNFKIAFGSTVYGYLNQYKMERAKAMLVKKNITIAEVSVKMGYKYPTHFSTAFKKYFGYLPNKIISNQFRL